MKITRRQLRQLIKESVMHHARFETQFINELGNQIQISIEDFGCGSADQLTISMIGPNSETENTITRMEAVVLNQLLDDYLSKTQASLNEGWFSDAFDKVKGYFGASKEQDYDNRFKDKPIEKALLHQGLSRRDIENAMKQMMQQQASSSIEDIAINTEDFLIDLLNNTSGNQMSFRMAEALVMQETDDLHYFQTQPDALRDMIEFYMPGIEISIDASGPNAGQEIIRLVIE